MIITFHCEHISNINIRRGLKYVGTCTVLSTISTALPSTCKVCTSCSKLHVLVLVLSLYLKLLTLSGRREITRFFKLV